MKRRVLLIIAVLVLAALMAGCSQGVNPEKDIVGTWRYSEDMVAHVAELNGVELSVAEEQVGGETMVFKNDGTFTMQNETASGARYDGSYTVEGDQINFTVEGGSTVHSFTIKEEGLYSKEAPDIAAYVKVEE